MLDSCVDVSEFLLQSYNCILFWTNTLGKSIYPFIPPAMGWILPLLFFYKDGFGIK